MKNIFIYIGGILLLLNTVSGLVLKNYNTTNWISNDLIILVNSILLSLASKSKIRDAFKISFSFILSFLGFIQFILGLFISDQVENNFLLIIILILFSIQVFFLLMGRITSKFQD